MVQIAFGEQGSVISGSDNGEVYVWDMERKERTHVLNHGKGSSFKLSTPKCDISDNLEQGVMAVQAVAVR